MRTPALRSRTRQDRGAVIPLVAIVLPVVILMTAFAVDLGRQRDLRRTMQARSDVVALDLIREVNGRRACELVDAPDIAQELAASAGRNDIDAAKLTVVWGEDDGQGNFLPHHQPGVVPDCDLPVPTRVEVLATDSIDYAFQPGTGDANRTAVAGQDEVAHLSVGSTLLHASLGEVDVLNPLFTGLLCPNPAPPPALPPPLESCPEVDVDAAGWQGAADSRVGLDELAAAAGVGTVDELLDAEVTLEEMAQIFAHALRNSGDPTTADIFDGAGNSFANLSAHHDMLLRFGDVLTFETPTPSAAAGADVNPLDTFRAGAEVANGENLVDLPITIPPSDLPLGISNLTITSRYQLIETTRSGIGRPGSSSTRPPQLRTAQLRVLQDLEFDLNLSVAGIGLAGRVVLPVEIWGGSADAYLDAINCASEPEDTTIDVTIVPRTIRGKIGDEVAPIGTVDLTLPALGPLLPPIQLAAASLRAHGDLLSDEASNPATETDVSIGQTVSVPANGVGLGGSPTNVTLEAAGVAQMSVLVQGTLDGLLLLLDDALQPALDGLGLAFTRADVTNIDASCDSVALVG